MSKHFLLALLIAVTAFPLFAQPVSVTTSATINSSLTDIILGQHGGNYYCSEASESHLKVTVLDSQFRKIKEADLSRISHENKKWKVFNYLFLDDHFYIFYFDDHKRVSRLVAADIDFSTLQPVSTPVLVATMNDPPVVTTADTPESTLWRFDIHYSQDGSHFAVNYVENNTSHFVVYNDKLEKKYAASYSYYFTQYFLDFQVSSRGTIALVHLTAAFPGKENNLRAQPLSLVVIRDGKVNPETIDAAGYKLFRPTISFTENDRPFVAGFYWHQNPGAGAFAPDEVRNVGTYFYSPGVNNSHTRFQPFERDLLLRNKSEKEKTRLEKAEAKGLPIGAEGIYDARVYTGPGGRIYLVGEESTGSIPFGIGVIYVGTNAVVGVRVKGNTKSFLGNLLVTQFDSAGNMLANTWVMKSCVENMYASYRAVITGDSCYIIFNDNYSNRQEKPANEEEVYILRPMYAGVTVIAAIGPDGGKTESLPFPEAERSTLVMINAFVPDENTLLFQQKKFNASGYNFCRMSFAKP
jgi:putative component of toxin-antitoxin plasmid stabilization module